MKENLSRMWRSGLAMLLALVLVVGMCPITAFAAEGTTELEAQIDKLMETVKQYAPKVADRLYDYVEEHGYIDTVNATFEELNAKVDEIVAEYENEDAAVFQKAIEMLNEQIALLEEQIPTLQEAGVDTAEIEAQIVTLKDNAAELQKGLDAADAAMKGLKDSLAAVESAIDTMVAEMKNPNGESIDEIKASLKATKATVEAALKDLKAAAEQVPTILDNLADLGIDAYKQVTECVDFVLADIQAVFDNLQAENNDEYESQVSKIIETLETEKKAIEDKLLADVDALYAKYDAKIAEANAELNATMEEMEAKIAEAQEDLNAEAERLQAEKDRLEALKAELEATKAELEARADALEAEANEMQAKIDEIQAAIDAGTATEDMVNEKAELEAKKAEWDQNVETLRADADAAKAKADQAQADADKAQADFDEIKAEMDQIRADLEAQYKEAIDGLEATAKEMVEQLKADLADEEKVLRDIAAQEKAKLEEAAKKAIEEAKKVAGIWDNEVTRAALEKAKEIALAVKDAVKGEVGSSIENADEVVAGVKTAWATVKEEVNALIEQVKALYYDATHEPYRQQRYPVYAALGETNAAVENSYTDVVDGRCGGYGFPADEFHKLAQAKVTFTDYYAQIENNTNAIAAADLITVDFSSNVFLNDAVNQMSAAGHPDWAAYVGETGANAILEALAVVNKLLEEAGIGTGTLKYLIEGYAYSYVSYVYHMPYIVNKIHEINPDAVVLTVGMHNSLDGVSLNINGKTLPLGKCVNILVEAANAYSVAYAMVTGKSSHVNAPDVEVTGANAAYSVNDILVKVTGGYFQPTANGHVYIADQIIKALELADKMTVARVWGADRYATSLEIADTLKGVTGVKKFDNVIVAYGDDFPDSQAGAYLAHAKNAPILLVRDYSANINPVVDYITENMVAGGTIYILGQTNAVSVRAENALKAVGKVERIGGADRWATSIDILKAVGANSGELIVASANEYKDALPASASGKPMLLLGNGKVSLRADQKAFLDSTNFDKITIIGNEDAITPTIEKLLSNYATVERIDGADCIERSVKVAEAYHGDHSKNVVLAWSEDFPDALCGGALALAINAPLVLSNNAETVVDEYVVNTYLGVVLGGEGDSGNHINDAEVVEIFEMRSAEDIVENPYSNK